MKMEHTKQQKEKGYLKIHIVVNIKTKEILSLDVTDEKVHDSKVVETCHHYILILYFDLFSFVYLV